MRVGCAALASLVVWLPSVVPAEESLDTFELSWVAPPPCPQVAELRAEVQRLVGTDARPGRRLTAWGTVTAGSAGEWMVVLMTRLDGVAGERVISGATCHAVSDAAVLTLALTLNPDLRLPTPVPDVPPPEPSRPPQQSPRPPSRPARYGPESEVSTPRPQRLRPVELSRPEPESALRAQWLGRAAAGFRIGTLPTPQPELTVGLGVARGMFLGWLVGGYAFPQSIDASTKPDVARIWVASTTALGCFRIVLSTAELAPCGGVELTGVWGGGTSDIAYPERDALYWVSPVLGLSTGYRLRRWLGVRLEGLLVATPAERPEGRVIGLGSVYQPGAAAGRVSIGIELRTM